ncbi:response regulator [Caulobacter sp. SLTY]|uniref:response regulator n=1 Tax=Caulobacter sp. SLTY TaxID=2683262 RepID=UPI0014126AB3|nr:response regulator [Caulobacter sp. SLTY]NBB17158.1 response regulator [Caulobacter sp. SLTY]
MTARVLIVEDEILTAMELEYVLTEQGYEVVGIAQDAASARELANNHKIDLALVDVNLRDGRTGVGLGAELARDRFAKVIYLTAHPLPPHERPEGVIGLLTKPSDEKTVVRALDYALHRDGDLLSPPPALQVFQ